MLDDSNSHQAGHAYSMYVCMYGGDLCTYVCMCIRT